MRNGTLVTLGSVGVYVLLLIALYFMGMRHEAGVVLIVTIIAFTGIIIVTGPLLNFRQSFMKGALFGVSTIFTSLLLVFILNFIYPAHISLDGQSAAAINALTAFASLLATAYIMGDKIDSIVEHTVMRKPKK